ncbi:STE/STE7/MEK4 protein kinase [Salpingoeca rosetta]|uniref:mitogen-activated protein kinase kinase n=1 Tax=Salpingoeca rosetta (strain ATCC 50818 / BSB-021) TaxID=946362 RepID=F2UMG3_SALR5|nr:STE/STE7/MEK4 protein kinase [Salpingoeca rosetta]EGD78312.1 STE/STE7/MEK4 protein kinase [Salpingoeca rosetta]|eukprot:XP_004989635.1 STE/STE7/MEK4 protein kinase [Salpingoeca rosetta]
MLRNYRAIGDEEGLKGEIGKLYIDGNVFTITTLEKDFEIGAELGHGTFGCVKTAVHRATNTTLAVKLLRDTMRADEKEKLIKELTLSRKFDSPYTVRYHGINVFDGQIQLFVEKMRMSLDSMIKYTKRAKQRVPEAVLGHITCCLIKGLDYMWHTHRAMHRDIKPSNALIGFDGSIKLCDFGLANIAVDSILISNVGSELYLSPEQLDPTTCQQGYDVRRDVWSLGVTLLEIANLEYPFRSEAEKYASAFTVMNRVTRGLIPRVKYEYSPSFQDLISSCLETDARWRPYFRVCAQPLKRLGSGSSSTASRQNSVTGRPDAHRLASIGDENPFAADMRESRDGGVGSGSQRSPAAGVSNHADTRGNAVASPASATSLATQSPHVSAEELAKREGKTIHPALMEHEFFKQYDKVELNVANWIDSLLRLPDMAM